MGRLAYIALALALTCCAAAPAQITHAQTESATAEDGKPASEAPGNTSTAPNTPLGANLAPPVGITPPIVAPGGVNQSGSATISNTAGTLTSGQANPGSGTSTRRRDTNTTNAPAAAPEATGDGQAAPAVQTCADFPTWYDAQLALESSIDATQQRELDPDGDTIACEEYMYPGS